MKSHKSRRGLTLIELLCILATMGIIAALLLPILGLAKEKAAQTSLRQKEIESMQSRLVNGLVRGPRPIELGGGWYYFEDKTNESVVTSIVVFLESNATNSLKLIALFPVNKECAPLKGIDKRLFDISDRINLTNGYYVAFQKPQLIETENNNKTPKKD